MSPFRNKEPGYFVVIDAEGAEIAKSRVDVPDGADPKRDAEIAQRLQASMGPDCHVAFKPRGGFR